MKTKIAYALAAISLIAVPAMAQTAKLTPLQKTAAKYASTPLKNFGKAWPASTNTRNLDPKKDPWKPVTSQEMAAYGGQKRAYQTSIMVDYNKDGVQDRAYIANNSSQGAVIVELGGKKGTVIAYKFEGGMKGGEEIAPAGNRIVLQFPEVNVLILAYEGKPQVYFIGD